MKMNDKAVHYLDKNTARLITSNQVIQGPYNVIKELVENALDANATSLEIRLDNFGLDKIEVKDNGRGVRTVDIPFMFLPGHSSKLNKFSDIESLCTYGFRGEALGAICCVANCTVTTKTKDDNVAQSYKFDSGGYILETKPSHLGQGTTVCVSQLFCHQPARRRMLLSGRGGATIGTSKVSTLAHIRSYLGATGVAWPEVRISLVHNGSLVWRKQPIPISSGNILISALGETLGHAHAKNFQHLWRELEDSITLNVLVPKKGCGVKEICQSTKAGMIIAVNKKIIHHKKIEKVLMQHLTANFPEIGRSKYPACVVHLNINPRDIDINLEPDKSKIMINAEKETLVLEEMDKLLTSFYGDLTSRGNKIILNDEHKNNNYATQASESEIEEPKAKKTKTDFSEGHNNYTSTKTPETTSLPGYTIEIFGGDKEQRNKPLIPENDTSENIQVQCEVSSFFATSVKGVSNSNDRTNSHLNLTLLQHADVTETNSSENDINAPQLNPKLCSPLNSFDNIKPQDTAMQCTPQTVGFNENSADITSILDLSDLDSSIELSTEEQDALMELEKLYQNTGRDDDASLKQCNRDDLVKQISNESLQKAWSRGNVTTTDGKLESCSVLTPAVISGNNISFTSEEGASASSQMGCHELAGFCLFCKDMRRQILQAEPGMIFTTVAQTLARRWKELPSVEKERYGELAKQLKLAKQLHSAPVAVSPQIQKNPSKVQKQKQSKKLPTVTPSSTKNVTSNANTKTETKTVNITSKIKRSKKEVQFPFKLYDIEKSLNQIFTEDDVLIGKIKNSWLLKKDSSVGLINPWVLHEVVMSEQLKAELNLPVSLLDNPLPLSSSDVGWQCWQTLSAMDSHYNVMKNCTEITSKLITSNGFRVTVKMEDDGCNLASAEIIGLTTSISGIGVNELKEILINVSLNPDITLAESRPQSILKFIKERASNNARERFENPVSIESIRDLLHQWKIHKLNISECWHGKQIYTELTTIGKKEDNL